MKPIKAWVVVSDEGKPVTCQTVFCKEAFAWSCFPTKAEAIRFAEEARRKHLSDFPKLIRVEIRPLENVPEMSVPLTDIRELLYD